MAKEGQPNETENGPEIIPTPEEVQSIFEQLVGEEKYEEGRKLEDEKGLYLWEVTVQEEDGHREYGYMRKGRHEKGQASDTAIHVVFFNKEGIPESGDLVAEYTDGEWRLTP